jgi:hypothetical protein
MRTFPIYLANAGQSGCLKPRVKVEWTDMAAPKKIPD